MPQIKDGVYKGTAWAHNGPMTVSVSLKDNQIKEVKVNQEKETHYVADYALTEMPNRIKNAQSYNVDVVSGATYTSNGIESAVKNALDKVDKKVSNFDRRVYPEQKNHKLSTDIVIVGSGLAGLNAAITAKENGIDVVILEKNGRLGGDSIVSAGCICATGSQINKDKDNDPEDLYQVYNQFAHREGGEIDSNLVHYLAKESGKTVDYYLNKYGIQMQVMPLGISPAPRAHMNAHFGYGLVIPLINQAKKLKIPIIREQAVKEIKTENGKITSVHSQGQEGSFDISAKAVVLTMGGFDGSEKMRDTYAPEAKGTEIYSNPANSGDYIPIAKDLKAGLQFQDGVMGCVIVAPGFPVGHAGINDLVFFGNTLAVDNTGHRFTQEGQHYPFMFNDIRHSDGKHFYWLYSPHHTLVTGPADPALKNAVNWGFADKVFNLNKAAKIIGCDSEVLKKTFNKYNSYEKTGDPEFSRKDIKALSSHGPYYVVEGHPATIAGFGGLVINTKAQALDEMHHPISGLYAAGEDASGQLFVHTYPVSGTMLNTCTVFGKTAGFEAAKFVKNALNEAL